MHAVVSIAAALADESRARIILGLSLLREKGIPELCVCQMTEFLALAPSTVSKHLSILRNAGLVEARKEGRWMYYRLPGGSGDSSGGDDAAAAQAIAWVRANALPKVSEERKKWEEILKQDPEELCRRQNCGPASQPGENSTCCSSAPGTRVGARWRKDSPGCSKAT